MNTKGYRFTIDVELDGSLYATVETLVRAEDKKTAKKRAIHRARDFAFFRGNFEGERVTAEVVECERDDNATDLGKTTKVEE